MYDKQGSKHYKYLFISRISFLPAQIKKFLFI